jgi:hypothetical protein
MLGLELYYIAFLELSTCRAFGMSEGPIPWTAIQEYCLVNEIEGEQKEDLLVIIRDMDSCYIDWRNKELERKNG